MRVEKEDISPTLRAQMAGHPPVVCYPTEPITLDVYHLSASRGGQTLKARDYKDPQIVCYAEKRFCEWYEDEKSVTLRASSGSYGGGSEVLVCTRRQSGHCAEQTTSGFSNNK